MAVAASPRRSCAAAAPGSGQVQSDKPSKGGGGWDGGGWGGGSAALRRCPPRRPGPGPARGAVAFGLPLLCSGPAVRPSAVVLRGAWAFRGGGRGGASVRRWRRPGRCCLLPVRVRCRPGPGSPSWFSRRRHPGRGGRRSSLFRAVAQAAAGGAGSCRSSFNRPPFRCQTA